MIAARGIHGAFAGPWSAGTTANLLLQAAASGGNGAGSTVFVKGGLGALTDALAAAARSFGAEIRTGAEVGQILTKDGAASGVVLAGGEEITARAVVSAVDLPRTFLRMLDPALLDPEDVRRVRNFRIQGMASKVNFALSGLPAFAGHKGADAAAALRGRIHIGADIDTLERAFDAAKYGEPSARPYLDLTIPSIADPGLAPAGQHVMSAYVQYTPYRLKTGSWKERAGEVAEATSRLLEEYAPGFSSLVLGRQVADSPGPGGDLRHDRRPPLARGARPRPALRHAAAARLGALPVTHRRPLPLQRGHASRAAGSRAGRGRTRPARSPRT